MTQPPDDYTAQLREQHRAKPVEFFGQLLREFFMNRDADQTRQKWQTVIAENRWYAEDVMDCMQTILVNPPDDLITMIQENGWVMLPRPEGMDTLHYHALYMDWLEQAVKTLSAFLA